MSASRIFNKLMDFTVTDFPKSALELSRFRLMLEQMRWSAVKDGTLSWEDRIYSLLVRMEVSDFPKSLKDHMEFNGNLLNQFLNKQAA